MRVVQALLAVALFLLTTELGLRTFMGFGSPILYENTYTSGYRPLPNQVTRRTGGKRVRINNLALRASRDWPPARPPGQLRLLYLGDSVTYGGGYVDDRETFVEVSAGTLAGALHRDVLAGNAGVNGWGPKNIRGLVSRIGCFGADLVVIVAQDADLPRDLTHMGEVPFWNHRPASAIEELLSAGVAYPVNNLRFRPKDLFVSAAERDSFYRSNIQVFVDIGRIVRAGGARVLMVWHPTRDVATGKEADPYREPFLSACRAAGLPALDMLPVVRSVKEPGRLFVDGLHLGIRGHALYGATLGSALAAQVR